MSHRVFGLRVRPQGVALLALVGAVGAGLALPTPGSLAAESAARPAAERRVSLDFVGADVPIVTKALSIQSGVNVVLMPSISGKVTIRQTNIPLEDALRRVAAAVGADVRLEEDTYFLGSTVELRSMVARFGMRQTVTLKHASAADVKELLQHALPHLTVESAGRSNILVLTGSRADVEAGARLAAASDPEPPQAPPVVPKPPVMVRDAYKVKFAKAEVLATTLSRAMPDLKVTHVDTTLVLEGTSETQAQATKLLAALDVQGAAERVTRAYRIKYLHPIQAAAKLKELFPNLVVSAGFDSYSPAPGSFRPLSIDVGSAFNQAGLQGNQGQAGSGSGGAAGGAAGGALDLNVPGSRARNLILIGLKDEVEQATQVLTAHDVAPKQVLIEARMVDMSPESSKQLGILHDWSPLNFVEKTIGSETTPPGGIAGTFAGSFLRGPFAFTQTLEAMETRREARILAKPNVAVVDGEDASIFIGDIFRYERLTSVTDGGSQTFTIETVPIGVALLCRPRITEDGKIALRVHPVVSTIKTFTGRNRDIPVTSSREAESVIMMNDGDTFAFGGLLREEEIRIMTKVPVLGNLPILGQLFRHRDNTKRKSEVTIFITARLVKTD